MAPTIGPWRFREATTSRLISRPASLEISLHVPHAAARKRKPMSPSRSNSAGTEWTSAVQLSKSQRRGRRLGQAVLGRLVDRNNWVEKGTKALVSGCRFILSTQITNCTRFRRSPFAITINLARVGYNADVWPGQCRKRCARHPGCAHASLPAFGDRVSPWRSFDTARTCCRSRRRAG
jgi:hypothetical protein